MSDDAQESLVANSSGSEVAPDGEPDWSRSEFSLLLHRREQEVAAAVAESYTMPSKRESYSFVLPK